MSLIVLKKSWNVIVIHIIVLLVVEKVKCFTSCSPQWRIYYHCSWRQLSNTCSNATEVAQWAAPSCSWPKPATGNGVRDGRSNWPLVTHTLYTIEGRARKAPERHNYTCNYGLQIRSAVRGFDPGTFETLGHRIAYAVTSVLD